MTTTSDTTAGRIADSAGARESAVTPLADFHTWFAERNEHSAADVRTTSLDALALWSRDPDTGNIRHDSGRFFSIEGLEIRHAGGVDEHWTQPIINQPEVGILGILAKEFDGVLHFLMQAKMEPGNCNGVQLSPTVQATRSNYTRVHRGRPVPYLDYFVHASRHTVLADTLQSEQGAWFLRKRNRNMVVEVTEDVPLLDDFRWLSLGQLHELFAYDNLINMDARTVLSCLPFAGAGLGARAGGAGDGFARALARSCDPGEPGAHTTEEVLSWIADVRARREISARLIPLDAIQRWERTELGAIRHESGRFFSVIGVDVNIAGREVRRWYQPMIRPHGLGLAALLVKRVDGVLHVLLHARTEPGLLDVMELAPTVQCTLESYLHRPRSEHPAFLWDVLRADPGRIRYDTVLSEEGGRLHHARTRHVIVDVTDAPVGAAEPPDYRWLTLHQLTALLRHSNYVNVQARSLVACLRSLWASAAPAAPRPPA